jgi:hypothetical protein
MNRKALLLTATACLYGTVAAHAWENDLTLVDKIDVQSDKGLGTFDISYVDPKIDLYVLADRTNASIDFVSTDNNAFLGRAGGFQGQALKPDGTADNTISGPDGVVIVNHKEVWAGDGDSTLKIVDIKTMTVKDTIPITDPTHPDVKLRVDEMTWDVRDHLVAAANNANSPPFISFVDVDTHKVLGQIVFDGTNNTPNATDTGIEQPQWSAQTGLIYVSVPQIVPGSDNANKGGIAVIDPRTMKVLNTYEVDNCSPAGLTIGPNNQALIGCSAPFGTPLTTQTFVINVQTGELSPSIPIGGSDEVWFDQGTNHYYLAARNNLSAGQPDPILGSVDASSNTFDGSASTSTTAHSVAASKFDHKVFVPIGFVPPGSKPGTDPTNPCPEHGCIAVFVPGVADQLADRR